MEIIFTNHDLLTGVMPFANGGYYNYGRLLYKAGQTKRQFSQVTCPLDKRQRSTLTCKVAVSSRSLRQRVFIFVMAGNWSLGKRMAG